MKDSDEESNSGKVGVTIMPDEITNFTYAMKSGPSSLDPGSMAFLLAWMGGSPGGQTVKAQQQSYLETYRERYPDGVAGVNNYITATTDYLAGKA